MSHKTKFDFLNLLIILAFLMQKSFNLSHKNIFEPVSVVAYFCDFFSYPDRSQSNEFNGGANLDSFFFC